MPNKDDLTKKIMTKVEGQEMKPKWYFTTKESLFLLAVVVLMLITIFFLSFFVWDVVENFRFFGFTLDVVGTVLSSAFLEIILIVSFLIVLIYVIYRQTDWFFVRHRIWLFVGVTLIAALASGVFVIAALADENLSRPFEETQERVERLPTLRERRDRIQQELEKRNIFVGRVESIERQRLRSVEITVANPEKIETFFVDRPQLLIREGQFVSVMYEEVDGIKQAKEIRKIRPGRFLQER